MTDQFHWVEDSKTLRHKFAVALGWLEFAGWIAALALIVDCGVKMQPYFAQLKASAIQSPKDLAFYFIAAVKFAELESMPALWCNLVATLLLLCIVRKALRQRCGAWLETAGEIAYLVFFLHATSAATVATFPPEYAVAINFAIIVNAILIRTFAASGFIAFALFMSSGILITAAEGNLSLNDPVVLNIVKYTGMLVAIMALKWWLVWGSVKLFAGRVRDLVEQARELIEAGRLEEAGETVREALRLDPDSVNALWLQAELAAYGGNCDVALKSYRKLQWRLTGSQNPAVHVTIKDRLQHAREYAKAKERPDEFSFISLELGNPLRIYTGTPQSGAKRVF